VLRVTITLEGSAAAPVFSRGFTATWELRPSPAPVRLDRESVVAVTTFVDQLRDGDIKLAALRDVAPVIARLVGTTDVDVATLLNETLELAAEETAALTEVPWETAAVGSGELPQDLSTLFDHLLARLPVCRIVPGDPHPFKIEHYRPRLLLCTSNPAGVAGGRINVSEVGKMCEQVMHLHPVFQFKSLRATSWQATAPTIRNFQPNIAVVVGHGSSDKSGGSPTLAFERSGDPGGDERVPIAEVANTLTTARSCGLVAMVACDLVRERGYSGACEMVRHGIDEVLAMQGSVKQGVGRAMLETFLAEILSGATLAVAAASARRSVRSDTHAVLPAAFQSGTRRKPANNLSELALRYEQALQALASRAAQERPIPRDVQKRLEDVLKGGGVAAAHGGPGNGASTVLRAAAAAVLADRKNRPIVYFDGDRQLPGLSLQSWIIRQAGEIAAAHPVLLPKTSPQSPTGNDRLELARWLRDAGVSIILDNVPYYSDDDELFVAALAKAYADAHEQAVLVFGGNGAWLGLVPESSQIIVGPMTPAETEAYVATFMPGEDPAKLFEETGGTPLLLDAERHMRSGSAGRRGDTQGEDVFLRYISKVDAMLSPAARLASLRLSLFESPLDVRLAEQFVAPDLPGALDELVNVGLATSFVEGHTRWIRIPTRKAEAIRGRSGPEAQEAAAEALANTFAQQFESEPEAAIDTVMSFDGGSYFLTDVQRHLAATGRVGVAVELPGYVQGKQIAASTLLDLYDGAMQVLNELEGNDVHVTLAAARAALNVGEPRTADEWLAALPLDLPAEHEFERLSIKAALSKDQDQASALHEIRSYFERAQALIATATPEQRAIVESFGLKMAIDSLPTALFLGHENASDAERRLAPALAAMPVQDRAQCLAMLAEREMKEPAGSIDWSRVAAWVTDAVGSLDASHDSRVWTYCTYEQAQYLKRRPEPRTGDAYRLFNQSKSAAETAGETRRAGLALLRLIELERDHQELQQVGAKWPTARLEEVDHVVFVLSSAREDSLSLRVLGRLQLLAAELNADRSARRERLLAAARAFASPKLLSITDRRARAIALPRALALDLGDGGDFLQAQRTLNTFRAEIAARLEIDVDIDNPEDARTKLSAWLERYSVEGA
jgi:hypothetical protein